MAHQIETMAYFGQLPWHGLGTALDDADLYDWPGASRKAGLDWEVELVTLVTTDTQARVDHRAVRRTSDSRVLGVVGPRYAPLQNKDAFAWFQSALANSRPRSEGLMGAASILTTTQLWTH